MTAETKRPTSPPEPTSSPSPPQSLEGNADAASHVDFEETKALSETKPGWQVFLVALGALMSLFLVALDRTIVSTAIPQITNDFQSTRDFSWYGSAYLLSCCSLQLLFGKLFTLFSIKYTLILSVLTFGAASALCGAAPSSIVFIIGRTIAGIGAAGIFAGAMTSMIHIVPLRHKPKLFAAMGSMQTIAQIGGPLIGGALTTHATWRWCFYINLPICGLALIMIAIFLDIPQQRELANKPLSWKIRQLDFPGSILVAAGVICVLLALQWGGQTYAWSNGRIIALLAVGIACLIGFAAVQILLPETATLPSHLFKSRTVLAASFLFVFFSSSNFVVIYFLPNWFQAITHVSAAESGIRTIPLMASSIIGLMLGGIITSKVGYYTPCAIFGGVVSTIGCGLITTFQVDSPRAIWIGYQVVNGIGLGFIYQVPNLAIQTVLPKKDAPLGFAMALFTGLLFSSVFIAVSENVRANELVSRLSAILGSTVEAQKIYGSGATTLLSELPADQKHAGLVAYNKALQTVFQIALGLNCVCVPAACALEWKSVTVPWAKKEEDPEEGASGKEKEEDGGAAEKPMTAF